MELITEIDQSFEFNNEKIRIIGTYDNPFFVAKDICKILGIKDNRSALRIIPDKWKVERVLPTLGGNQNMVTISEPGLYKLVMRSNKPIAQKFQEVVCEEILPTIRKTGEFNLQKMLDEKDNKLKEKDKEIQKLNKIAYKKQKQKYEQSHSVYIISNPDIKDCYKIGVTNDRNRRLADLGPGAPLHYKIEHSRVLNNILERSMIENALLSVFSEYREINDTAGSKDREWIRGIPLETLKIELDFWVDTLHSRKIFNPDNVLKIENLKEKIEPNVETNIKKTKDKPKTKREKRFWTEEEVKLLKEAIDNIGTKWKKILDEYPLFKKNGRTNVDLKDKYRNVFGNRSKNFPRT